MAAKEGGFGGDFFYKEVSSLAKGLNGWSGHNDFFLVEELIIELVQILHAIGYAVVGVVEDIIKGSVFFELHGKITIWQYEKLN